MSRPMYENNGDRSNEHEIMSSVASQWGVQFYKLPIAYRMDYILMSAEKAKAFVECKHRNITWGDYPDVMLSLSKVQQAQSLLDASGLRSLFIVRATDRIFYTCLNDCAGQINWVTFGGRTYNTRDAADVEPVMHIPTNQFVEVPLG
jgi:hypothetical protein